MIEVIVIGEGPTEETFVRDVLALEVSENDISLQPRTIPTSRGASGGALARDRVLHYLRNTLRERGDTYVTTLFDLYGLRSDFPGVRAASSQRDPMDRCRTIEQGFSRAVIKVSGCRPHRFIPHVQPHEFEALLFSKVACFGEVRPEWNRFLPELQRVRDGAKSPEHIDDCPNTHPSAWLKRLPSYEKVLHGSLLAKRIGIGRIRSECEHFDAWLTRIEQLPPLR